jgi:predicted transcriptional regulator
MVTTLNLPDQLHEQLKALAEEEHRSMNATILVAVERYVESRSHRSRVRELALDVSVRDAELLRRLGE